jgi:hypothetical protein
MGSRDSAVEEITNQNQNIGLMFAYSFFESLVGPFELMKVRCAEDTHRLD